MVVLIKFFAVIAAVALMTAGCGDNNKNSISEEDCQIVEEYKPCEEIDANLLHTDADSNGSQGSVDFEIIDPESLDENIKEKINFKEPEQSMTIVQDDGYQYILISAGIKPFTGYTIRVGSFEGFKNLMVLDAFLYPPSEECDVDRVETYPSLLLRIDADDREIVMYLTNVRDPVFR